MKRAVALSLNGAGSKCPPRSIGTPVKFHLTNSFPAPASRLWEVAVETLPTLQRGTGQFTVAGLCPTPIRLTALSTLRSSFETTCGQLTVQILNVHRDGNGGVMTYTISEGLPPIVRDGRSTWTISSAGPDKATLDIDVESALISVENVAVEVTVYSAIMAFEAKSERVCRRWSHPFLPISDVKSPQEWSVGSISGECRLVQWKHEDQGRFCPTRSSRPSTLLQVAIGDCHPRCCRRRCHLSACLLAGRHMRRRIWVVDWDCLHFARGLRGVVCGVCDCRKERRRKGYMGDRRTLPEADVYLRRLGHARWRRGSSHKLVLKARPQAGHCE